MERLTEKMNDSYIDIGLNQGSICECVEKLGKLEDIEEELGIPLEVLFKALKDGVIWTYDYDKNITRTGPLELGLGIDGWYLTNMSYIVWIKDYGKTWWLEEPKEKLENV